MDELSKELFLESGRPAITITSRVSDNRSTDNNALSVSFQIPAQDPDPGDEAGLDSDLLTTIDVKKIQADQGTPWMKQIEQDYYNTARASVVAEIRARHRSKLLCDFTTNGIIAPWALSLAPMPVYLHPLADKVAAIMKKQALDLQLKIADLLHEQAEFQAEKITVDKASLQSIFGANDQGYRLAVGALFDSRRKVQVKIKEQLGKYSDQLVKQENQVSDKDLCSMVRGIIPQKYSYAAAMELANPMDPPPPADRQGEPRPPQERGRARSRSRSRRRGRSSSRPAKRRNFQQEERDYGFDKQPQQNNPQRGPANGGNYNSGQGARPKTDRPYQNQGTRMDQDSMDPRFFTPDLIRKIAEAYDGLHK